MSNGLTWTEEQFSAHMNKDGKAASFERQSEREFQREVIKRAALFGWRYYHTYNSRRSAAGFPDLVLARGDRLIFAELKTEKGNVSEDQQKWLESLGRVA